MQNGVPNGFLCGSATTKWGKLATGIAATKNGVFLRAGNRLPDNILWATNHYGRWEWKMLCRVADDCRDLRRL
jgi:hypothetical protein